MSRLEELIQGLCPDGVEYKRLEDVCDVLRGKRLTKSELSEKGKYPVLHGGSSPMGYFNQANRKANTTVVVNTGNSAGCVFYYDREFWSSDACFSLYPHEILLDRFLYFYLSTCEGILKGKIRKGAMPTIDSNAVESLLIPIPPLEVQHEIVRILDSFTELTAELTTELTTELTARKQQYEYYRDTLLMSLNASVSKVRLGDICTVITKGTTPPYFTQSGISFIKTEAFEGTQIVPDRLSYVDENTHTTILKRSILQENDILLAIAGSIGKCVLVQKEILPANTNQALAIIRLSAGNSPKYVMYLLQSCLMKEYMQKCVKGSAQPNLNLKQINDFVIPLPTIEGQKKIVNILDSFDSICSDLTSGLPAEIEARQKQYEYYRDKLLTFKEKEA